jgi:hypothetical protein
MNACDFTRLWPDVVPIADEVDAPLTPTIDGYMKVTKSPLGTSSRAPRSTGRPR